MAELSIETRGEALVSSYEEWTMPVSATMAKTEPLHVEERHLGHPERYIPSPHFRLRFNGVQLRQSEHTRSPLCT